MTDVVYYVRPGEHNPELRWSLRSLCNLPHERVWIVGHKPSWVIGVEHVPGNRGRGKEANAVGNLRLACQHVRADRFVVFNDDFYVMEPVATVPSWHDGPLPARIARATGRYRRQLEGAARLLTSLGRTDPLAWTLHIPLEVECRKLSMVVGMLEGLDLPAEWRTVYGNVWHVAGELASDVKVRTRRAPLPAGPFLSSRDDTLRLIEPLLGARFPQPGPYELMS